MRGLHKSKRISVSKSLCLQEVLSLGDKKKIPKMCSVPGSRFFTVLVLRGGGGAKRSEAPTKGERGKIELRCATEK